MQRLRNPLKDWVSKESDLLVKRYRGRCSYLLNMKIFLGYLSKILPSSPFSD
jgi:hypothetical protein